MTKTMRPWRPQLLALLALSLLAPFAALAEERSISLKISGWHSKGDSFKTEVALKQLKGVKSASAEMAKKQISITFDDAIATQAQLEKAIAEAGYSIAQ